MKLISSMLLLSVSLLYGADKFYAYGDLDQRHDGLMVEVKTQALANGIGRFYYDSGKVRGETLFKEGKREGMGKTYFETGELQGETPFVNDKIEGMKKNYFSSGRIQAETPYKDDLAQGVAKTYYESGKLQSETPLVENKADGVAKVYFESGQLAYEIEFKNNIPTQGFQYDKKGMKSVLKEEELQRFLADN